MVVVLEIKTRLLARSIDNVLRFLLAVIAVYMLMLAINVSWMLTQSFKNDSEMLQTVLLAWISALLYGGVCELIAAFKNRLNIASHVVACWLLIAVLHVWYIVEGRHRLLHLPQASSWNMIVKISADLFCVVSMTSAALLLRWNRELLGSSDIALRAVIPIVPAFNSVTYV